MITCSVNDLASVVDGGYTESLIVIGCHIYTIQLEFFSFFFILLKTSEGIWI